jgi:hypothetical protein
VLLEEGAVDAATVKSAGGLLEKKWTSVLRLQKKVMQLEEENKQLKENSVTVKRPANMALPLAPALHVLKAREISCPRLALTAATGASRRRGKRGLSSAVSNAGDCVRGRDNQVSRVSIALLRC